MSPQRLEAVGSTFESSTREKWDDGSEHDDVTKIFVRNNFNRIGYIQLEYIKSGQPKYGFYQFEISTGFTQTFELNHLRDEQLESVEVYHDPHGDVIRGIQFKTNLRISELIGNRLGTKFSLAVEGKKIIGFHGSSYTYLSPLGAYSSSLTSLGAYFTWITPSRLEAKGGNGGKEWNDGADHEGVTKIYVRGGLEGIQYIKFDYVKDGQPIYGPTHGVSGKGFTQTFEINHLNKEYLVSVEGYYDDATSGVMQGLRFKTNIKTSELIGDDKGKKFRLEANGKKIIGFHGYSDNNLKSLGAYFATSSKSLFTKLESKGDTASNNIWDDGTFDGVRKVHIYHADFIHGVIFDYDNGGKLRKQVHGFGVDQGNEFLVDYPNEFITWVEGSYAFSMLSSLSFKTSKGRTSPTFGNMTNSKFVLENNGGALVGFYGWSSKYICGLGAYFCPLPHIPTAEKLEAKGGDAGASWDDGGFDGIRKIYIGYSKNMDVAFVKFLYDKEDQLVVGDDHGSKTLSIIGIAEFKLVDYPDEYLISVEGRYVVVGESEVIQMLRFKTNKRSQTFGFETGTSFILEKKDHKIVGFHGKSSDMLLHKIGVHVIPI